MHSVFTMKRIRKFRKKSCVLSGLVLSGAWLAGCETVVGPEAAVVEAVVTQQTDEGARVELVLEMENPNTVPLPVERSRYTVSLEGVGQGVFRERHYVAIPAAEGNGKAVPGRQRVVLPVVFAGPIGELAGRRYRVRGTLAYEPPGEIRKLLTESHFPLPVAVFHGQGQVAVPDAVRE